MIHEDKNVTPADYNEYYNRVGFFVDGRVMEIVSLCPKVEKILDLGGGTGNVASQLVGDVTVVDWSDRAGELAKVKFVKKDILDYLKETEQRFELVILADVLEEMKASQTKELIEGINKVATKYFVISTPTHENYLNLSTHQVIYTEQEINDLLVGWKMVEKIPKYTDRLIALYEKL